MNYKIYVTVFTVIITLCACNKVKASDTTDIRISKNIIYMQLAGKGNARSINFERVFQRGRKMNYSYGVGFSLFNKNISVPVTLSAITTAPRHHLEISVAVIPYIERHLVDRSKNLYDKDKQMYIKPSIGYRYQKAGSGFFMKVGAGPQIFLDPPSSDVWNFTPRLIRPSAHIAAGFSF